MDKDEILEKNRRDSGLVDERFQIMEQRTGIVAANAMMVVWVILFFWDFFHGQDTSVGTAIMLSGVAAMGFYRAYLLHSGMLVAGGALAFLGAIGFIVNHVLVTM